MSPQIIAGVAIAVIIILVLVYFWYTGKDYTTIDKWNFPGDDVGSITAKDINECVAHCRKSDGCVGFAFRPNDGSCWVKDKLTGSYRSDDVITGVMSGYEIPILENEAYFEAQAAGTV